METIGAFRIVGEIARGGMGVIYRVRRSDSPTGAEYALKLVNDQALDAEGLARFQREMEALGRLGGHPNLIRVSTSGHDPAGRPYYVMELVAGVSLHERVLKEGPLEGLALARLGVALASALEHCHQHGIVHRDLKPANILLRAEDGTPVVTDFGLASLDGNERARLTQTQDVLGTPVFMPPEQAMGRSIDPRSDVYGLGAVLFAAASGEPPVAPGQQMEVLSRVALGQLTPLARVAPRLPKKLVHIIERALATRPEDRFQSAKELEKALADFLEATVPDEDVRRAGPGETRIDESRGENPAWRPQKTAAPRSRLVLALGAVVLAGLAGLGVLVPRALAIREKEKSGRVKLAVAAAVRDRREGIEKALAAGRADDAASLVEEAARAAAGPAGDGRAALLLLDDPALAPVAARALAARGAARLAAKATDTQGALADLDAAGRLAANDAATASEVLSLRADALVVAGDDAMADQVLAEALAKAPTALARASLAAKLGRLRVAALDLAGAEKLEGERTNPDAFLLRFELALAKGALDEAAAAFDELAHAPRVRALDVALAEVALADARHRDAATRKEDLEASPRATRLDAASIEAALAALSPVEAASRLDAAIAATGKAGGRLRALRLSAQVALAALHRRAGDFDGARERLAHALADARSAPWRARIAIELGRTAFLSDELDVLHAQVAAASSQDATAPDLVALRALDAREGVRSSISRWTARFVGGAEGLPATPVPFGPAAAATVARRRARRALAVARTLPARTVARAQRDLARILDIEAALSMAKASDGWQRDGLHGFVEQVLSERPRRDEAAERKKVAPWRRAAIAWARVAADLAPDDGDAVALLLEALVLQDTGEPLPPEAPEEIKRTAARLERLRPERRDAKLLLARAASATGDIERGAKLAGALADARPEDAEAQRVRFAAVARLHDPSRLQPVVIALLDASGFDPSVIESLVPNLKPDKSEQAEANLRAFALHGAIGKLTFDELEEKHHDRGRVLQWLRFSPAERNIVSPAALKGIMDACGSLATAAWREPELRAQLVWTRGEMGEGFAKRPESEASALVDLAEGARTLPERSLAFLVSVDRASSDSRWEGLPDALSKLEDKIVPTGEAVWNDWEDLTLLRAALGAVAAQHDPAAATPEKLAAALERAEEVLDSTPESVPARIVRAVLLARLGREAEADEDVAAALAVAPELERPDDAAQNAWIAPFIEGAKKRLAALATRER